MPSSKSLSLSHWTLLPTQLYCILFEMSVNLGEVQFVLKQSHNFYSVAWHGAFCKTSYNPLSGISNFFVWASPLVYFFCFQISQWLTSLYHEGITSIRPGGAFAKGLWCERNTGNTLTVDSRSAAAYWPVYFLAEKRIWWHESTYWVTCHY